MLMHWRYCICLLLLLPVATNAQTMIGRVLDLRTGKPLSPVTVVNIYTQQSTSTDDNGMYSIPANTGDMIAFTYIGFKTVKKTKPASTLISTIDVGMEPADYLLPEFKVLPGNLTAYQKDSMERRSIYKVPLQRTRPTVMSPASMIAEKFSLKAKMVYLFQKNFAAGEMEKYIDTRYTKQLVNELTGATGDSIGNFMYAYPMPYDFARWSTDLELKMWIRDNYREWLKVSKRDSIPNH